MSAITKTRAKHSARSDVGKIIDALLETNQRDLAEALFDASNKHVGGRMQSGAVEGRPKIRFVMASHHETRL